MNEFIKTTVVCIVAVALMLGVVALIQSSETLQGLIAVAVLGSLAWLVISESK